MATRSTSFPAECRKIKNGLDFLAKKLDTHAVLRCGWFADIEAYDDGTPGAVVAIKNEFGAANVPPRPFVRPAIAREGAKWLRFWSAGMWRVVAGKERNLAGVFHKLGQMVVADLKDSIMMVWSPPLRPFTIEKRRERWYKAKGNTRHGAILNKPLVDTTRMITSVSYRVHGGE